MLEKSTMLHAKKEQDLDALLLNPDFRITSAVLYHPDLSKIQHNTELSGDGQPSPFYMLKYHQDRMLAAVKDLSGNTAAMLQSLSGIAGLEKMRSAAMHAAGANPSKLRFTLDRDYRLECTSVDLGSGGDSMSLNPSEYFPASLPDPATLAEDAVTWLVGISNDRIQVDFTTKHKTTLRKHYELASKAAPDTKPPQRSEVLVYNDRDQIMEGCSTTPYFWRDGRWITPHAQCGGNLGTTRRWSLDRGLAVEGIIEWHDVCLGEIVILSNGVRGFGIGRIVKI